MSQGEQQHKPIRLSLSLSLSPMFQVGDQVLEVNGRCFHTVPHDEAVLILRSAQQLQVCAREVGRLPHARTIVDETRWIPSGQIAETSAGFGLSRPG